MDKIQFAMHHIGCVVPDMEKALDHYINILGYKKVANATYYNSVDDVRVCFIHLQSEPPLELIEFKKNSPITRFINNPKGGVYHICIKVKKMHEALEYSKINKYIVLSELRLDKLTDKSFAFLLTQDRHLLEICNFEI